MPTPGGISKAPLRTEGAYGQWMDGVTATTNDSLIEKLVTECVCVLLLLLKILLSRLRDSLVVDSYIKNSYPSNEAPKTTVLSAPGPGSFLIILPSLLL